jgi:hypothetical protein
MPEPKPTPSGHKIVTDPRTIGLIGGAAAIVLAAMWLWM